MGEKVSYLTAEGRARLEQELHYLHTVRRPEIAARIRDAKREGDVSENAGYEDAKHEQAFIEGRIGELEDVLKHVVIIGDSAASAHEVVALGCHVTICEHGEQPETYHIVGSVEADPTIGRISNECPLGQALLGRRQGDEVQVKTPAGGMKVHIVRIE